MAARTTGMPVLTEQAAVLRRTSLASLREKLALGHSLQSAAICSHIYRIFAAEGLDHNISGATAHGKMLRSLFEEYLNTHGSIDGSLTLLLTLTIYCDAQFSAMFLTPPIFDYDDWLPKVYAPLLAIDLPFLPSRTMYMHEGLNEAIYYPLLRSAFLFSRRIMEIWLMPDPGRVPTSDMILAWIAANLFLTSGRLVNHYLEFKLISESSQQPLRPLYIQQYLALAALHLIRSLILEFYVGGKAIFDASAKLLTNLRRILELCEQQPDDHAHNDYHSSRLWALYVGALAEQQENKPREFENSSWFGIRFARQAETMGLSDWGDIVPILHEFLYHDSLSPHGSSWFPTSMQAWEASGDEDRRT